MFALFFPPCFFFLGGGQVLKDLSITYQYLDLVWNTANKNQLSGCQNYKIFWELQEPQRNIVKLESLWWRANARNVSFFYPLQWLIYIFNSVVNAKLPAILSHQRSTTVSLETYPFKHFLSVLLVTGSQRKRVVWRKVKLTLNVHSIYLKTLQSLKTSRTLQW